MDDLSRHTVTCHYLQFLKRSKHKNLKKDYITFTYLFHTDSSRICSTGRSLLPHEEKKHDHTDKLQYTLFFYKNQ